MLAEAEENNLGDNAWNERWARWYECSLCEQQYHGVVACALGWACWKTYVGRPEVNWARRFAMNVLGNGVAHAQRHEDTLSIEVATLATMGRLGTSQHHLLKMQGNIAGTYNRLGRLEDALRIEKDVYSGYLKLLGEEHDTTIIAAHNYASSLTELQRFREAKALSRRLTPVARRVLGESNETTLRMKKIYAVALYQDPGATLGDLREAVTALEEIERIARRVFGGSHPRTVRTEVSLREARAVLRARETPQEGA